MTVLARAAAAGCCVASLAFAAAPAAPSPPKSDSKSDSAAHAAYAACTDKARTNVDFQACGAAYVTRADAALNLAWTRAQAALEPASRAALLKEQRSWLAFRDASCSAYMTGDFGREGEVISFYACRGHVIETRTADLDDLAKGGD